MHMTLLAVLIAVALPLVSVGMSGSHHDMDHASAASAEECAHHVAGYGDKPDCTGMALHCVALVMADRKTPEQMATVAVLHHARLVTVADGIAPEASSPPPRG